MGAYGIYPVLMYINGEQESCIRRLFHLNNWTLQLKELSCGNISHLKLLTDDSILPFILRSEHLQTFAHFNPEHDPDSDVYRQQYQQQHHHHYHQQSNHQSHQTAPQQQGLIHQQQHHHHYQHGKRQSHENAPQHQGSIEQQQQQNVSHYHPIDPDNKPLQQISPHEEIQQIPPHEEIQQIPPHEEIQQIPPHGEIQTFDTYATNSSKSHAGNYNDDLQADGDMNLPVSNITAEQQSSYHTVVQTATLHTGLEYNSNREAKVPNEANNVAGFMSSLLHISPDSDRLVKLSGEVSNDGGFSSASLLSKTNSLAKFPSEVSNIESFSSASLLSKSDSDRLAKFPSDINSCPGGLSSTLHTKYVRESCVSVGMDIDYAGDQSNNVGVVVELTNAECALEVNDDKVPNQHVPGYSAYGEDSGNSGHRTTCGSEETIGKNCRYTGGYVNKDVNRNSSDGSRFSMEAGKIEFNKSDGNRFSMEAGNAGLQSSTSSTFEFNKSDGNRFSLEAGKTGIPSTFELNRMIFTLDGTSAMNAVVRDQPNSGKCDAEKEMVAAADDDAVTPVSDIDCSEDGFDSEGTESNIEDIESYEYGVRCYDFDGGVEMSRECMTDPVYRAVDLSVSELCGEDNTLRKSGDTDRSMDECSIAISSAGVSSGRQVLTAVDLRAKSRHLVKKQLEMINGGWAERTLGTKQRAKINEAVQSTSVTQSITTEANVEQNDSRASPSEYPVDQSVRVTTEADVERNDSRASPSEPQVNQSVHTDDHDEDVSSHKDIDSWTVSPFSAGFRRQNAGLRTLTDQGGDETHQGGDKGEKGTSWIYSPFPRKVDWEKLPPKATLCPYCNRIFASQRTLRPHIAEKHPKYSPTYRCHTCKLEYKYKPDLSNHKKQTGHVTKAPPVKIVCELCGKSFTKKGYDVHVLTVHNSERNFYCSSCGKSFKSKGMLQAHERGVHDSTASTCNICHKRFKNNRRMLGHRLIHDKKNWRHVCKDCGRSFFSKENLEIHGRTHTGEKPYKCRLCTYACTCKQNLHKHMNVHWKQINI